MDLLILLLCRRILGYRRSLKRAFLAALFGAVYALFVLPFDHPAIWLCHLLFGSMLPLICCGYGNLRRFLRLLLYFYGIGFFLGGALSAALRGFALYQHSQSSFHLSFALILLLALITAGYCLFFGNLTLKKPGGQCLSVCIERNGECLHFQGYADTGNTLREPIENLPVILANEDLSQRIYSFYKKGSKAPTAKEAEDPHFYDGLPLRMVPCKTVAGKTVLPALRANAVINGRAQSVCIALNFKRKADYCGFEALIPTHLF